MKKVYYRYTLTQTEPLRIGAGATEKTDSDVIKDSLGFPLIPGTSLTGVLRSMCPEPYRVRLFGDIHSDQRESKVLVFDAVLAESTKTTDFRVSRRDGVGLDDNGVNKRKAKYDFEVAESKQPYTAILELADDVTDQEMSHLESILCQTQERGIKLGARTTRGYGRMTAQVRKKVFNMPADLDAWLVFDPFTAGDSEFDSELESKEEQQEDNTIRIHTELKAVGSYSVRVYTTALPKEDPQTSGLKQAAPDMTPLCDINGDPTIPGTSWAGAFVHHLRHLALEIGRPDLAEETGALFGTAPGSPPAKSKIEFRTTNMKGSSRYTATRTAIDRFTAKPQNQALFTSEVARGGTGELNIELPADTPKDILRLLAVSLNDLHFGLLTFGGESSVGRGQCEITALTVNGSDKLSEMKAMRTDYLIGGNK